MKNHSLPGMVKVGLTRRNLKKRMKELSSSTSIPTEFNVYYYVKTSDCVKLEKVMHRALRNQRVSTNREFFRVSPFKAKLMLMFHSNIFVRMLKTIF